MQRTALFFSVCCLCTFAQTSEAYTPSSFSPHGVYLGVGGGEFFARVAGNNSLNSGIGWPQDAYITKGISDQPFFFFSGGYQFARQTTWLPFYSVGFRYSYISTTSVNGNVYQYSLPDFFNYTYYYDIALLTFLGTVKLDLYRFHGFMPYVIGGAGVTNFSTSNYQERATSNVTPRVNPAFGANGGNNFTYTFGAGIDYAAADHIWVNLEFNYNDYGTIKTAGGVNYNTLTGTNYDDESLRHKVSGTAVLAGVTFYLE